MSLAQSDERNGSLYLTALADEYLDHLEVHVGPHTLAQRRTILRNIFMPWAAAADIESLDDLDRRALDRFSRHLQTQPGRKGELLSPVSVETYCRNLNLFLGWCKKHAGADEQLRATAPAARRRDIEVLTREEITHLEEAAANPRDALIIRLLADTGIREGELVGLRVRDVVRDEEDYFIRVHGKTGGRTVGISPKLYRRLIAYIRVAQTPKPDDDAQVFVTLWAGRRGLRSPLTGSGVAQIVRWAGKRAGLSKNGRSIYPHLLRHSFATWFLDQGGDGLVLRRDLGHRSMAMIDRVYFNLAARKRHEKLRELLRGDR